LKIIAKIHNQFSCQDEPTQMFRGEIRRSNIHSGEWQQWHLSNVLATRP